MMSNLLLTVGSFVSAVLFPWPITGLVALATAYFEPLVPLAVGLFADTLYYTPQASSAPWFSVFGLVVTIGAVVLRSRIRVP
jgi:hypothetical protein